jgi:lysophospholipase L1-like esterase
MHRLGARLSLGLLTGSLALCGARALAQPQPAQRAGAAPAQKWVAGWTASPQGPYPVGNATAQPDLSFAIHDSAKGASNQTFRLIVHPGVWGRAARIHLSNAFGTKPVMFDGVFVGVQDDGSSVLRGTNHPVSFQGRPSVTVQPGQAAWSDPVRLDPASMREGRRLAVSFHVAGDSGPITWHAKALTTSYVSAPGAGSKGGEEGDSAFPNTTTSWYFLDEVDVLAPAVTRVIVALGDSITDGTASTLNGDDRWPDVLARRLRAAYGPDAVVVNAGIGGNQVLGPAEYSAGKPFSGGPSAGDRLERDVIGLSGVTDVIWLEGINDFGAAKAAPEAVAKGMEAIVQRLRARIPGVKIYGATLTPSLNSTTGEYGTQEVDQKRKALNQFIRQAKIFDGIEDFEAATLDPETGTMRAQFQPNSTTGGPGDRLHPNHAGYLAMGEAVDVRPFAVSAPRPEPKGRSPAGERPSNPMRRAGG